MQHLAVMCKQRTQHFQGLRKSKTCWKKKNREKLIQLKHLNISDPFFSADNPIKNFVCLKKEQINLFVIQDRSKQCISKSNLKNAISINLVFQILNLLYRIASCSSFRKQRIKQELMFFHITRRSLLYFAG
jgi:hypothetical protein